MAQSERANVAKNVQVVESTEVVKSLLDVAVENINAQTVRDRKVAEFVERKAKAKLRANAKQASNAARLMKLAAKREAKAKANGLTMEVRQAEPIADLNPPLVEPTPESEAFEQAFDDKPKRKRRTFDNTQELSSTKIGKGRYKAYYRNQTILAMNTGAGWRLQIDGTDGRKLYATKREALNNAKLALDSGWGKAKTPTPVEPTRYVASDRKSDWRTLPATKRQYWKLKQLEREADNLDVKLKARARRLSRGEASDLIQSLSDKIEKAKCDPMLDKCSIGPFSMGYCTECGKPQA